jgi:fermentation-respiration switch protein FrsA (DUF1100 family)
LGGGGFGVRPKWWIGCLMAMALTGCATTRLPSPLGPLERSLVFQPAPYPAGDWSPTIIDPEDAWFESADETKLHGWFVAHPHPQGVALLCHGNAGNVSWLGVTLAILRDRHRLSVLAFDYRGYGRSEGRPTEPAVLEDARAARQWLAERTGVGESDVILMGISLGGGVAVDLAQDGARGLVLASTFSSLPDVAQHHVWWLPVRPLMTSRMNSLEKIRRYEGPVLISHGDADEVVPFEQGERLYDAAPGPKRFVRIPNGRHNDPQPESYRRALDEFLAALPPESQTESRETASVVR